jgi:hypothetical protein
MIYFTKYSEQKFDILNRHKVFFTREMVEETVKMPDNVRRKGKFYYAQKDGMKVAYRKERDILKVLTFYPVK